jgi:hypothetical protein
MAQHNVDGLRHGGIHIDRGGFVTAYRENAHKCPLVYQTLYFMIWFPPSGNSQPQNAARRGAMPFFRRLQNRSRRGFLGRLDVQQKATASA